MISTKRQSIPTAQLDVVGVLDYNYVLNAPHDFLANKNS
jgi:hypothetical protein